MEIIEKKIQIRKCEKCGWEWLPRVDEPKRCPRCQAWLVPMPKEVLKEVPQETPKEVKNGNG